VTGTSTLCLARNLLGCIVTNTFANGIILTMGVRATLYKLSISRIDELPEDEYDAEMMMFSRGADSRRDRLDLEKSHRFLHFLFSGLPAPSCETLSHAVMGGEDTHLEIGYGYLTFRTPALVVEISELLQSIDYDEMCATTDFSADNCYVSASLIDDEIKHTRGYFHSLQTFYLAAAIEKKAVLFCEG